MLKPSSDSKRCLNHWEVGLLVWCISPWVSDHCRIRTHVLICRIGSLDASHNMFVSAEVRGPWVQIQNTRSPEALAIITTVYLSILVPLYTFCRVINHGQRQSSVYRSLTWSICKQSILSYLFISISLLLIILHSPQQTGPSGRLPMRPWPKMNLQPQPSCPRSPRPLSLSLRHPPYPNAARWHSPSKLASTSC